MESVITKECVREPYFEHWVFAIVTWGDIICEWRIKDAITISAESDIMFPYKACESCDT